MPHRTTAKWDSQHQACLSLHRSGQYFHTGRDYRLSRDAIKGIVGHVWIREDNEFSILFFGEKDIVIRVKLPDSPRIDTQLVLKPQYIVNCALSLLKGIQFPDQVLIFG